MKRPALTYFLAINNGENLSIKAAAALVRHASESGPMAKSRPPWNHLRLLNSGSFTMRLIGLDSANAPIFNKTYESDSFGDFSLKMPCGPEELQTIKSLAIYELKRVPGIEFLLGHFIPQTILSGSKLVISDFDKTLVDTQYETTRQKFRSLTQPMGAFPTVKESVDLLQSFIAQGFHPFIVSASPHFYYEAIRDWLYQNRLYTTGIFLKDYRKIISYSNGELSTKDLHVQGIYKLGHLLDIILMAPIPQEVVLIGDNVEADPIIYLSFAAILQNKQGPWQVWNRLKNYPAYQMTPGQSSILLNKIYQLQNLLAKFPTRPLVKIFIRIRQENEELKMQQLFPLDVSAQIQKFYTPNPNN